MRVMGRSYKVMQPCKGNSLQVKIKGMLRQALIMVKKGKNNCIIGLLCCCSTLPCLRIVLVSRQTQGNAPFLLWFLCLLCLFLRLLIQNGMKEVAIQGIKGCFHEVAAQKYFGAQPFTTVECLSFNLLFGTFKCSPNYYGMVAIENSLAGTILPNYALLRNSELSIIGEVYLRIEHNLLALEGQQIEEIREVYSHPMAIAQCYDFFDQYPHIRLIESADTALSAREIGNNGKKGIGAIAGKLAAQYYNLAVMAAGIESNKQNFTRFWVVQHNRALPRNPEQVPNKASVCFHAAHHRGELAAILTLLAQYGMNLTKIQSLPLPGKPWEYFFHIDLTFSDYHAYRQAIEAIGTRVNSLRILGEYPEGEKTEAG